MTHSFSDTAAAVGLQPEYEPLFNALAHIVERVVAERSTSDAVRALLGPDALIPYGDFLKANHISYELGQRLRDEGRLKVLQVGGKLMVRRGHAEEFVRKLPLVK